VTAAAVSPHSARALAAELAALKLRLDALESGARADQLGRSSIENGHLAVYDDTGTLRSRVGRQDDGTFVGGVSVNNPVPPPRPRKARLRRALAGLYITGDGSGTGRWPADFSHYNIYATETTPVLPLALDGDSIGTFSVETPTAVLIGTLGRDDDAHLYPMTAGASTAVWLTAVNQSGVESEPGPAVYGTAAQVVSDDISDDAVGTLQLAAQAVQEANIAVGAVTGTAIAPDSIGTPHLVAGAVDTAALAADAVAAGTVAADAITAREVAAGSLTGNELAANTITAGNIQAGVVDATLLAADLVLATRVIVGAADGDRLELHPTAGLQGWKSGVRTLSFDVGSGSLTAIGQWATGVTGERLVIQTDGSMAFYDAANNVTAIIDNAGAAGTMLSAGTTGSRGSLSVVTSGSHLFWGNPGAPVVNSEVATMLDAVVMRSPTPSIEVDRRFGVPTTIGAGIPQIILRQRDWVGNTYNSEIVLHQCLIGGTSGHPPGGSNQEQMIFWVSPGIGLSATSDIGTTTPSSPAGTDALYVRTFSASPAPIAASAFYVWSGVDRKAEVTPFEPGPVAAGPGTRRAGPPAERLFAAFERAPAYRWRYKQPGDPIDETDPARGVVADLQPPPLDPDAPPPPPRSPRREPMRLFPIAEELAAVAPELVTGDNDPVIDLRDMIGWLWATCGRLHARVTELETP
jgi:hypothetical protein